MTNLSPDNRRALIVLTGAKTASNAALRWVGPFLPTLERAFGASTSTMTSIMGAGELFGLNTVVTGRYLDRGHERRTVVIGLWAVTASSLLALFGTVPMFAVAYALIILGVGNITVAGHAWIGHRVRFAARGHAIGIFETSWAFALLIGAPIIATLLWAFGWRGAFVGLAAGTALAAIVVQRRVPADQPRRAAGERSDSSTTLPRTAFAPMVVAAASAAAGLGVFVISGTWLDDRFGLSTAGLGMVSAGLGAVELVSSTAVAAVADRIGTHRSVAVGLGVLLVGVAVMGASGGSLPLALLGLLMAMAGFEYGFVSSLTLVTEAAPEARGKAIGLSNAVGTVARAGAVAATGLLYDRFGHRGSLSLATGAAAVALMALAVTRRQAHHIR